MPFFMFLFFDNKKELNRFVKIIKIKSETDNINFKR